jgi:PAS domain S-box-containing protein
VISRKVAESALSNGKEEEACKVKDEDKTKEQLIAELVELRRRNAELEMSEAENRQTEEALRESEERFKQFFENVPEYCYMISLEGVILNVNNAVLKSLGYKERELVGRPLTTIYAPESLPKMKQIFAKWKKTGELKDEEIVIITKKGNRRTVLLSASTVKGKDGAILHSVSVQKDITERKRMEEALAAERERLAVTLRSIGDGVIVTDAEGRVTLINKVAETLTGWTEEHAIGKPLSKVFYIINEDTRECCENPVERVLETGGVVGIANRTVLIAKDGTERIIADSGAPIHDREGTIGVVVVFRDVTERRRMEEELQKMERLESIGVLAGGIAHDFNNILTAILGNISLARMYTDLDRIFERLAEAERASMQAQSLTQQLLTFSRGGAPIKKTVSIAELLRDSVSFALRGSNARCELSIPDDLWSVEVDEGQIGQVISNIVINADHAMPRGGIIKVRAENVTIGAEDAIPLEDGEYVKIYIEDRGIGIPKENLDSIFDPYFTTKQKGSGLGLATSYSIIKNHEGHITVESELGAGTTFHIYLPASPEAVPTEKKEAEEKPIMGEGRILVMDDEKHVRDTVAAMLNSLGYKVTTSVDGAEAIELYKDAKESGQPYDAVIVDIVIPGGMGGRETIQRLMEIDPEVRVIVSSGYSDDPIMADFSRYGFKGAIAKPYKTKELSEVLHRVIMGAAERK